MVRFPVEGEAPNVNSLWINPSGNIAFSVNTVNLIGTDHHDGNIYLWNRDLELIWHKQFTDKETGIITTKILNFTNQNEIISAHYTHHYSPYYSITSSISHLLPWLFPKTKDTLGTFNGLIHWDMQGKVKAKMKTDVYFENGWNYIQEVFGLERYAGNQHLLYVPNAQSTTNDSIQIGSFSIPFPTLLFHEKPSNTSPIQFLYRDISTHPTEPWKLIQLHHYK